MKYWSIIKDFFIVFDEFKESGWRVSESIVTNAIVLVAAAVLLIFGVDLGLTGVDTAAIATFIVTIVNIVLRYRSGGGQTKLKIKKQEAKFEKDIKEINVLEETEK